MTQCNRKMQNKWEKMSNAHMLLAEASFKKLKLKIYFQIFIFSGVTGGEWTVYLF